MSQSRVKSPEKRVFLLHSVLNYFHSCIELVRTYETIWVEREDLFFSYYKWQIMLINYHNTHSDLLNGLEPPTALSSCIVIGYLKKYMHEVGCKETRERLMFYGKYCIITLEPLSTNLTITIIWYLRRVMISQQHISVLKYTAVNWFQIIKKKKKSTRV
jgi:hypothetical protein